ncbi:hypothetical protein L226DRAFT_37372 [Lentinus tigrinus ALCF2SS1-7]|uniref:uncharacterized protein n=1 Tax=Lentinus tigrinus ALCF2SS1-7 TaxID=1328758 RepID=UPI0011661376|nr:hypothetical protein L226DRAFT_37372 [Lentinus tigrinus ALCF2SS1-7]
MGYEAQTRKCTAVLRLLSRELDHISTSLCNQRHDHNANGLCKILLAPNCAVFLGSHKDDGHQFTESILSRNKLQ